MPNFIEQILELARTLPEGGVLRANELLHLGGRAAIGRSLSRLVKAGQLLRAGRFLYVRPVETRFGVRPPSVPKVIEALAEARGEAVASSGAAAANTLGLTTLVPVRLVYWTSGRSRVVSVGAQSIELRHAPSWQLELHQSRAGQAIRALAWFGKQRSREAVQVLRGKLSGAELQSLAAVQGRLPTWVAQQVRALTGA